MAALTQHKLEQAVRDIKSATGAEEIRLFGSRAYGKPGPGSDIDLLVIVPDTDRSTYDLEVAAYRALRGCGLPIELKVTTREAYERRATWLSTVERVAHDRGRPLHVS